MSGSRIPAAWLLVVCGTFCPAASSFTFIEPRPKIQQRISLAPSSSSSAACFPRLYQGKSDSDEHKAEINKKGSGSQRRPQQQQRTSFLTDRIQNADPLEIRLDATLASVYVLCRFLIFDLTTGAKDHPGWEFKDVLWLLQTFSSAILLATLWTGAGLLTRIFEGGNSYEVRVWNIIATVVVAAPIWLLMEIQFGWPPAGLLFAEGTDDLVTLVSTGSVGLCSVMLLGKYFTSGWR